MESSPISPLAPTWFRLNALPLHTHQLQQHALLKTTAPPMNAALPEAGTFQKAPTMPLQASADPRASISMRTSFSPTILIRLMLPPLTKLSSTVFAPQQPTPLSTALPSLRTVVALISF